MKRSILCLRCEKKHKELNQSFPGEHIYWVDGKARYDMVCDFCNALIEEGTMCCAESIWMDPQKKFPWEDEIIERFVRKEAKLNGGIRGT